MTVKELILKLSEFDGDKQVRLYGLKSFWDNDQGIDLEDEFDSPITSVDESDYMNAQQILLS